MGKRIKSVGGKRKLRKRSSKWPMIVWPPTDLTRNSRRKSSSMAQTRLSNTEKLTNKLLCHSKIVFGLKIHSFESEILALRVYLSKIVSQAKYSSRQIFLLFEAYFKNTRCRHFDPKKNRMQLTKPFFYNLKISTR